MAADTDQDGVYLHLDGVVIRILFLLGGALAHILGGGQKGLGSKNCPAISWSKSQDVYGSVESMSSTSAFTNPRVDGTQTPAGSQTRLAVRSSINGGVLMRT